LLKFRRFDSSEFAAGERIKVLIGFKNNGAEYLNVSSVGAFLLSPYDSNYGIQNVRQLHF
jgi:hypothetical protein